MSKNPPKWLSKTSSPLLALTLALWASGGGTSQATDGTWTNNVASSGFWSDPTNWTNAVVADGLDGTADFSTLDITTDTTVHLDSARTIGNLMFDDIDPSTPANWILDNNGNLANMLTLGVSSNSPTITVNAMASGSAVTISAILAGTNGLTKNGDGTLILTGTNTYTGITTVSNYSNLGMLSVGMLANSGQSSGIGAYPTPGPSGLVITNGTFDYSGDSVTTDRGFTHIGSRGATLSLSSASPVTVTLGDCSFAAGATGNEILTINAANSGSQLILGNVTKVPGNNITISPNIPVSMGAITWPASGNNIGNNGSGLLTLASLTSSNTTIILGGGGSGGGLVTGPINLGSGGITKAGNNAAVWRIACPTNTFTGQILCNAGFFGFDTITNVGAGPSSLGAPTNVAAGTINLGRNNTANIAGIVYTGTGSTSDRVLNLASTTGNATVDMSGTGRLKFTSDLTATGAGSKTLFLIGSTTGIGELAGAVVDNTNAANMTSLTKDGTGTWVLSASNSYSGPTTVNNGTLLVNSPGSLSAASAVTVNFGGTLGGDGTINGSVTVADGGNLSPGIAAGTLTINNSLDVSAMAAGTMGKLYFDLGTPSASDRIVVTGSLTIGTDVLGISDFVFSNLSGFQNGTYTLLTSSSLSGTLDPNDQTNTIGGATAVLQISGNNLVLAVSGLASLTPPVLSGYGPRTGTSFPLTFSGPSGQTYGVLMSTNVSLPLASWTVLSTGTFGSNPVTYTDSSATNSQRFYRIQSP